MAFSVVTARPLTGVVLDVDDEELCFRLPTGRPCLDLVATVGERWGRCFERLRSPDDLARWLIYGHLVDGGRVHATDAAVEQARRLRAAVFAVVEAGVDQKLLLPAWAVSTINKAAAAPDGVPVLDRRRAVRRRAPSGIDAALSRIARDVIALVTSADVERVRECAAPTCSLIFFDDSPRGNRRWCSMRTCGTREKVRAHRARAAAT